MTDKWTYEKFGEDFERTELPIHDTDGSITGKVIINLGSYFDENPEERIKLGWIKHYHYDFKEIDDMYDHQTQYYIIVPKMIDEFTIEDTIVVFDKTEDMLAYEELHPNQYNSSFSYWLF